MVSPPPTVFFFQKGFCTQIVFDPPLFLSCLSYYSMYKMPCSSTNATGWSGVYY